MAQTTKAATKLQEINLILKAQSFKKPGDGNPLIASETAKLDPRFRIWTKLVL